MGGVVGSTKKPHRYYLILISMVAGVALLQGATGLFVTYHSFLTEGMVLFFRIIQLLVFLGAVFLFPNRLPNPQAVCAIMIVFGGAFLLALVFVPYLDDELLRTIMYFATAALYGVAAALLPLFAAQMYCRFPPKVSAVLFGITQLITNVAMAAISGLHWNAIYPLMLAGAVIGAVCLAAAFKMQLKDSAVVGALPFSAKAAQAGAASPAPSPASGSAPVPTSAPVHTSTPEKVFPYIPEWSILVLVVFIFSFMYGLASRVSTITCSPFSLFDIYTGLILFMFDTALVVFLVFKGEDFNLSLPLLIVSVLSILGFAIFSFVCRNENPLASAFIRSGYDCAQILVLAFIARIAYQRPNAAYCYFGLFSFFSSTLVGELVGQRVIDTVFRDSTVVVNVAILALILIGVALCIVIFSVVRLSGSPSSGARAGYYLGFNAGGADGANDTSLRTIIIDASSQEGDLYQQKIESFIKRYCLTQREADVLIETLHGLNRASVASKLYLSPETVKSNLGSIYRKSRVSSRQELIAKIESEVPDGE